MDNWFLGLDLVACGPLLLPFIVLIRFACRLSLLFRMACCSCHCYTRAFFFQRIALSFLGLIVSNLSSRIRITAYLWPASVRSSSLCPHYRSILLGFGGLCFKAKTSCIGPVIQLHSAMERWQTGEKEKKNIKNRCVDYLYEGELCVVRTVLRELEWRWTLCCSYSAKSTCIKVNFVSFVRC